MKKASSRIVFAGPVPALRLWAIVHQFAAAHKIRMLTDRQQQHALSLYVDIASMHN